MKAYTKIGFSILLLIITGCDSFYHLTLTGEENNNNLHLQSDCGEMNVELGLVNRKSFDLRQSYSLQDTLTMYKDSLGVYFKGKKYPVRFIKKGPVKKGKLDLIGKSYIRTSFGSPYINLIKGDTLKIYPEGYLYCQGRDVSMDSIEIVMPKDF